MKMFLQLEPLLDKSLYEYEFKWNPDGVQCEVICLVHESLMFDAVRAELYCIVLYFSCFDIGMSLDVGKML